MTNKIADAFLMCESREEAETLAAKAGRYAARNGYTIERIYVSRCGTDSRLLDRVIDSLAERKVRLLIFSDTEALGNDEMIKYERRSRILRAEARLVFLKSGAEKTFMFYWLNTVKDYNSYALEWKIRLGIMNRPAPHKITNGSKPYGYDSENGYYAVNEEQSEDVKRIFDLYDSGLNAAAIAEKLNENGREHRFPASSIMSILQNEHYKGTDKGQEGTVPAIIRNGQFLRVKGRIEKNRKDEPAAYLFLLDNVYFISGKTRIKLKAENRSGSRTKPVYCARYKDCLISADAEKTEKLITDRLYADIAENADAECKQIISFAQAKRTQTLGYIEEAEKQKEISESEFNTVFSADMQMQTLKKEHIRKFDELKTELDELNRKLNRAGIILELCSQDERDIYDFFGNMRRLPDMHRCEAAFFLKRLISRVNLNENGITVECNYGKGRELEFSDTHILSVKQLRQAQTGAETKL